MFPEFHPAWPFAVGALLCFFVGPRLRRGLALLAPLLGLASVAGLPEGAEASVEVLGRTLHVLHVDPLGRVFALAFALYGVIAGLYAWTETGRGPRAAALSLTGGGVGVALAGDLVSLYFFWEWLTVGSVFLVWFGTARDAVGAGQRYLYFHVAGAMCLLAGILVELGEAGGPILLSAASLDGVGGTLILVGLLTNAAVPPLHAWLPDAYPRANVFGTVFLAAFTTKGAVYALVRLMPGTEPLIWLGAAMALYGVIFAVLENDIRRLLGYHIISQVGYMVCGVGLGTAMALNGTSAHAFCHIFYKGLLLMSAGAVIHAVGTGKLTELGGLARPLKATLIFCLIGGFSISGVPLFSGFVSKTMVVSASAKEHYDWIYFMLEVASMGTFLHTGLKLPWFTFFDRAKSPPPQRSVPWSMHLAMGASAAICIGIGVFPHATLYPLLPHVEAASHYEPYTGMAVIHMVQLLVGTAFGFWLLRKKLGGEATVTLDVDRLYRGPVAHGVALVGDGFGAFGAGVERATRASIRGSIDVLGRGRELASRRGALAHQLVLVFGALALLGAVAMAM